MSKSKILDLDKLAKVLAAEKKKGRKIVHCHGVFDLLHIGHIRHFRQAREMGDILVVTLTQDQHVNKGPGRPAFNQELRLEAVASLDVVDYVACNKWPTAVETVKLLKPDYYVKGVEYKQADKDHTGGIVLEEEAVEAAGGQLAFTDDIVFSSSSLINRHISDFPKKVKDYIAAFGQRYKSDDLIKYLKEASKLKVLVVGETIIDEYQYCEAIGKSSKEPTLAVKEMHSEKFAGGILAVANHVAGFCGQAAVASMLGDYNTQEEFITAHMLPEVKPYYLYRKDSPTIVKKRVIEHYFFTKMLEIYSINDARMDDEDNQRLCDLLEEIVPEYDLVIVVDFGHSMMTPEAIKVLTQKARFLAVNAQANAGNMGYNVISRYPRADYITMAEKEMRLEARNHRGDLHEMVKQVSRKMKCPRVVVTQGRNGSLCYDRKEGFFLIPALAREVVDRVGAGDAFLSISSLCAVQKAPMEVLGFIGNAVGAYAVSTVCNKKPVSLVPLCKQIEHLLK
jgi:rfaE bifunctional protein kinase chain/domain/rfaE bifunctional protein nucleotidyltransferase chain/domain